MVKVKDLLDFDPDEFDTFNMNEELNDLFTLCREHYIDDEDENSLPF